MDDLLPSYESAIQRNPWVFIAPFLPSSDLCSATLVCRTWHDIFTPSLWGSPASHFGIENDVVYVALTRFKRTLPFARLHVRELTHTLHFPPAHAELYDGPHSEWLRDCLEYLPRLQCLIVNRLPFFDHASLLSLRYSSLRLKSIRPNAFPVFGLRLLDATGCTNATSTSLSEALPHFPDLVSLDLSRTLSAKTDVVFSKLNHLRNLRVLSLRGLGLRDTDLSVIAQSIGIRVRSLDVSNNHLTDNSARLLLQYCLKEGVIEEHVSRGQRPPIAYTNDVGGVNTFEAENLVDHLRRKLTEGFIGSLAIEEARDVGITHLYLTNNAMTVEGVSGLLRSQRLQVLDIGMLACTLSGQLDTSSDKMTNLRFPGVAKLGPVLSKYASTKLRYLRVNYGIVTEDAPRQFAVPPPRAELSGDLGRYSNPSAHELEAIESPLPELDSGDNVVVEIAGDSAYPVELPASSPSDLPTIQTSETTIPSVSLNVNSGAAYAPEPVFVDQPLTRVSPLFSKSNYASPTFSRMHDMAHGSSPWLSPAEGNILAGMNNEIVPRRSRHNSTHYVEDRRARLELRQSRENRLHPGSLPKMHTLVLTDVPAVTSEKRVITNLIQFIKDAAEEASMAKQRARQTYVLPPGRTRAVAEQEYARSLFALQRIVLEMAPPQAAPKKISTSWRAYPTKSSTEDADSEAFWEAAKYDFSFFDEEECGLPNAEPGRTMPLAAMSGLELAAPATESLEVVRRVEADPEPLLDVIGELGNFRRERKAVYINLIQMGQVDAEVEGYWPGDITVVRKPVNSDAGELDCYGNRYEAGWYYR